jgi:hypothetical protein
MHSGADALADELAYQRRFATAKQLPDERACMVVNLHSASSQVLDKGGTDQMGCNRQGQSVSLRAQQAQRVVIGGGFILLNRWVHWWSDCTSSC